MAAESSLPEDLTPDNVTPLRAAAQAAAEALGNGDRRRNEFTTDRGIVLKLRPVSSAILRRVASQYPEPPVPKVVIKRGAKEEVEENPDDPDYLDAKEACYLKRMDACVRACVILGTEPLSVPGGCFLPDDDGWVEELAYLGIQDIDLSTPHTRYGEWLALYAFTRDYDQHVCAGAVMAQSGLMEDEVGRMSRFLLGRAARGADSGLPAAAGGGDGDNVREPDPGPRKRGRGA